jgi:riboflavin kinase/FMN adenylyltransferase
MAKQVEIVSKISEVSENRPTFLAIGVFDGVHLGHQKLLQNMVNAALKEEARAAVLTFYPHPISVIQGRKDRLYLNSLDERVRLLAKQGLDLIITLPFTDELRHTRAELFIEKLCQYLGLNQIWGGAFSLGYNREGDLPFLRLLGQQKGYSVLQFEAMVEFEGQLVSSSRVRNGLREGDIEVVSGCLGRPYRLTGKVVPGDGRGRTLGIPTANLSIWEEQLLPATGVYATYTWLDGKRFFSATNVGYRPTVSGHSLNVETHLLDFDDDIYDREVALEFIARIRDEQKFANLDALITQINRDITAIRQRLESDG